MRKRLKELLILTFVLILSVPTLIYCDDNNKVDRYSKSSILIDQTTNRVMFEKDPDAKRPLASLSKMMTFLIALEAIENKEVSKNDIITIDKDMAKVKGSSYHLKVGEKVPLYELMKGLMIVSGNDASIAIAKHISKDEKTFVERMNAKAKEIGMINTSFVNPNGLPIYDLQNPKALPKENISTARDIAKLGKYMFDNYEKEVVAITDMQTYSYPERNFQKNNTNALLGIIPAVDGIKTGYTGNAGYCLAFSMVVDKDKDNEIRHRMIGVVLGANHKEKRTSASLSILRYGKENFSTKRVMEKDQLIGKIRHRMIGVVLGANHKEKRTSASLSILRYGKENFSTKRVMEKDQLIGKKYIKGLEELEVTLKSEDELYATLKNTENLKSQITLKELKYPVKKGDTIGVIKYFTETGQVIGSVDIISANDVDNISFITKIKMIFTD